MGWSQLILGQIFTVNHRLLLTENDPNSASWHYHLRTTLSGHTCNRNLTTKSMVIIEVFYISVFRSFSICDINFSWEYISCLVHASLSLLSLSLHVSTYLVFFSFLIYYVGDRRADLYFSFFIENKLWKFHVNDDTKKS